MITRTRVVVGSTAVFSIAFTVAAASVAFARASSLHVSGPRSGTHETSLRVTVSGYDTAPLNHLFVVSANPPGKWGYVGQRSSAEAPCAPTSTTEVSNSAALRYLINEYPVGRGPFSHTLTVSTANIGRDGVAVCAYLYVAGKPGGRATVVAHYKWTPRRGS